MASPLPVIDGIGLAVAATLAFIVGAKSASAYNLTGRSHLLNFSVGFACLGLSYLSTIGLALLSYPQVGSVAYPTLLIGSNLLPRLFIELLGFALIASSYYGRERASSFALLILLVVASAVAIVDSTFSLSSPNAFYAGTIRLFDMALVIYSLIQVSRSYTTRVVSGSFYVSWGFGALALGQYTWLLLPYGSYLLTAELAGALRIIGLALLVKSLRK